MKVKTLDNKEVSWRPKQSEKTTWSVLHLKARGVLKSAYPTATILEEVSIPVTRYKTLYLDFYVPVYNLAVEADGSQHDSYSKFFFKNKRRFRAAQENDYLKTQFCEINNITLIRFPYNESIEQWRNLLI